MSDIMKQTDICYPSGAVTPTGQGSPSYQPYFRPVRQVRVIRVKKRKKKRR